MHATSYTDAKTIRDAIEADRKDAARAMQAFPRIAPFGLIPDSVKASPEYRAARDKHEALFQKQRKFNAWFVKAFAKEIRAERRA